MSDTPQGPEWWQASDGKWYPPELFPADWPHPQSTATQPVSAPTTATPDDLPVADVRSPVGDPPAESPIPEIPDWTPPAAEPTLPPGTPVSSPPASAPTRVQPVVEVPSGPPSWDTPPAVAAPQAAPGSTRSGPDVPAATLAVVGGAAVVVGSFLEWAKGTGVARASVTGIGGSNGPGTLAAGIAVLALAVLLFLGRRAGWVGGLLAAASATALGLAVFSMADISSVSDDLPGKLEEGGFPPAQAAQAGLGLSPGIWIVAAGAVVALVAGVLALLRRSA